MTVIKENQITKIKGTCIPKPEDDQNTDDIMPARFMTEITFSKMGEYLYFDERFKNGEEIAEHPFNKYKNGSILIGGANYGCGSSREHAPQALQRFGIKAIIAPSYAEIFAGNCASLGIVAAMLPDAEITNLVNIVKTSPETEVEIDLENKTLTYNDQTLDIDIVEGRRKAFINGIWDAMAVLQASEDKIEEVANSLPYLK